MGWLWGTTFRVIMLPTPHPCTWCLSVRLHGKHSQWHVTHDQRCNCCQLRSLKRSRNAVLYQKYRDTQRKFSLSQFLIGIAVVPFSEQIAAWACGRQTQGDTFNVCLWKSPWTPSVAISAFKILKNQILEFTVVWTFLCSWKPSCASWSQMLCWRASLFRI